MRWAVLAITVLAGCTAFPTYREAQAPIASMATFDPARYSGLWYEIASFPAPFQSGCRNTTAAYELDADETITVTNRCDTDNGARVINGTATIEGQGRLKIRLNGVPFAADYWVLWVDEDYRTAVVGTPTGRSGWILNREPTMPADRFQAAQEVLAFNGYDVSALENTVQEAP